MAFCSTQTAPATPSIDSLLHRQSGGLVHFSRPGMAGFLPSSWVFCRAPSLDSAPGRPGLQVFACSNASDVPNSGSEVCGDASSAGNGADASVSQVPLSPPRLRRRSLKKSKGMAALQSSLRVKVCAGDRIDSPASLCLEERGADLCVTRRLRNASTRCFSDSDAEFA